MREIECQVAVGAFNVKAETRIICLLIAGRRDGTTSQSDRATRNDGAQAARLRSLACKPKTFPPKFAYYDFRCWDSKSAFFCSKITNSTFARYSILQEK